MRLVKDKHAQISLRSVFILMALVGVLILATINFTSLLPTENNQTSTILENDIINSTFNNLQTNLSAFRSTTQGQTEAYQQDIPERGFGSLIIFTIVGVGNTFMGLITGIYNIMIVLPSQILGVPKVVMDILGSIFLITIIFLSWRLYRVGS